MKKQIVFTIVSLLLFLSSSTLFVSANPLPVPEQDYSPINPGYNDSIEFFSEEVIYIIDNSDDAEVNACYVFRNKKNETVTKTIFLPFVDIPSDLQISEDGKNIPYKKIDFDLKFNETYISDAVSFNLTFLGYELITINIHYTLSNTISEEKKSDYIKYSCRYLSETGKSWNNSLKYANFSFKIKKSLYNGGISGFYVEGEGDYVIASKNLTDWVPNKNIKISWRGPNDEATIEEILICCGTTIAVIVVVIVVIYLVIRKLRGNKNQQSYVEVQNYRKSCPFCNKTIPFDAKICPYCGKRI
ncbi:MAG: hypothetical protein V5A64_04750 [Candidatus Thermoplasmatota archaeon]